MVSSSRSGHYCIIALAVALLCASCAGTTLVAESNFLFEQRLHKVTSLRLTHLRSTSAVPPSVSKLSNIQWLHIPKTGTSFVATLWSYACGQGEVPIDLGVDPTARPYCAHCYDLSLRGRYPKYPYCERNSLHTQFQTQHAPQTLQKVQKLNMSLVGFFRRPSARMVSAYYDGLHASGIGAKGYTALSTKCKGQGPKCFAEYPGIAGCATRMLTGKTCAVDVSKEGEVDQARVQEAIQMLEHMPFVGLTEEWDESVCLFHLMFGGKVYRAEFKNYHSSAIRNRDEDIGEFVDEADEAIYAAAKARFESLRMKHAGKKKKACDVMMRALGSNDTWLAFTHMNPPVSKGCAASGYECGVHKEVDCGVCSKDRVLFMDVEKGQPPKCSPEGKCLFGGETNVVFRWNVPASVRNKGQ